MFCSPSNILTHHRLGSLDAWGIVMWACEVMKSGTALGNDSALTDIAGLCRAEAEEAPALLAALVRRVEPDFDDAPLIRFLHTPAAASHPALRVIMFEILNAYAAVPPEEERARSALVELFACLSQPVMRTGANCVAVEWFFSDDEKRLSATMLPPQYVDFLSEPLGLHDTLTAPQIAANFGSTPEQLLRKARRL